MDADQRIIDRLYEYAFAIDTRDWPAYRRLFADRVWLDFEGISGAPGAESSADEWVASTAAIVEALDATQHVMSNPQVVVDGERARCRMYIQAMHFLWSAPGESVFTVGGWYDDTLVLTGDDWLVAGVTFNVFWRTGNEQVMALAQSRAAAGRSGHQASP